jgi:hypothetical protein
MVLVPGNNTEKANEGAPKKRNVQELIAQSRALLRGTTDAKSGSAERKEDQKDPIDAFRDKVADLRKPTDPMRRRTLESERRRLLTPELAKRYLIAAARQIADWRRMALGTASQTRLDAEDAKKNLARIEPLFARARADCAAFLGKRESYTKIKAADLRSDDEQLVGALDAAGKPMTPRSAFDDLQDIADGSESRRWEAVGKIVDMIGSRVDGNVSFKGAEPSLEYNRMVDSYAALAEALDDIAPSIVKPIDGAREGTRYAASKDSEIRKAAGEEPATMRRNREAIAESLGVLTVKERSFWDDLIDDRKERKGRIVLAGYKFEASDHGGINVEFPIGRSPGFVSIPLQKTGQAVKVMFKLFTEKKEGPTRDREKENDLEKALLT